MRRMRRSGEHISKETDFSLSVFFNTENSPIDHMHMSEGLRRGKSMTDKIAL